MRIELALVPFSQQVGVVVFNDADEPIEVGHTTKIAVRDLYARGTALVLETAPIPDEPPPTPEEL